ncbi:MAG: alpha/beta hydrolase [Clostridia bacterium]|nr:alpha/beta hydrolase [Clostridia bacterium]
MEDERKRDLKYDLKYLRVKSSHLSSEILGLLTVFNFNRSFNVKTTRRVRYCEDDQRLFLNIYQQRNRDMKKKQPVFVYIHGGGWMSGSPNEREAFTTRVANSGYFVVGLFYGLAPFYSHPDFIENIYKAFAWLVEHQEEYNIEVDSIFVGGESAGAHLSAMAGAISTNKEYNAKFNLDERSRNIKIKGLILISGVYDMVKVINTGFRNMNFYVESFCGKPIMMLSEEKRKEVSPINFVTKDFPPSFVVLAERDKLAVSSIELMWRFEDIGVDYDYYFGKGFAAVHAFPVAQILKISREAMTGVHKFLKEIEDSNKQGDE